MWTSLLPERGDQRSRSTKPGYAWLRTREPGRNRQPQGLPPGSVTIVAPASCARATISATSASLYVAGR